MSSKKQKLMPTALMSFVFGFLDVKTITMVVSRVCRDWKSIRAYVHIWPRLYPEQFLAALRVLGPEVRDLTLDIQPWIFVNGGRLLDQKLIASLRTLTAALGRLTKLTKLSIKSEHGTRNSKQLLEALSCPGLETLSYEGPGTLSEDFRWTKPDFASLSHVTLRGVRLVEKAFEALPNLRTLILESCHTCRKSLPFGTEKLVILVDCGLTEEELVRVCVDVKHLSLSVSEFLNSPLLQLTPETLLAICQQSINLHTLEVKSVYFDRDYNFARLAFQIKSSCKSLQWVSFWSIVSGLRPLLRYTTHFP